MTSVTVTGQMMMTSHMVTDGHLPSITKLSTAYYYLQHYFSRDSAHYRNDQHQMRCRYMQALKMPKMCTEYLYVLGALITKKKKRRKKKKVSW